MLPPPPPPQLYFPHSDPAPGSKCAKRVSTLRTLLGSLVPRTTTHLPTASSLLPINAYQRTRMGDEGRRTRARQRLRNELRFPKSIRRQLRNSLATEKNARSFRIVSAFYRAITNEYLSTRFPSWKTRCRRLLILRTI